MFIRPTELKLLQLERLKSSSSPSKRTDQTEHDDLRPELRNPLTGFSPSEADEMANATFLITDVVGSTRLWEENAETMSEALFFHEEILRAWIGTTKARS
jgi:class 3 adenylate cyclase